MEWSLSGPFLTGSNVLMGQMQYNTLHSVTFVILQKCIPKGNGVLDLEYILFVVPLWVLRKIQILEYIFGLESIPGVEWQQPHKSKIEVNYLMC